MSDKASQQIATAGWIVHAETVDVVGGTEKGRTAQFWLATYADASEAVKAVEAAPGLVGGAHVEAKKKATAAALQKHQLPPNRVKLIVP